MKWLLLIVVLAALSSCAPKPYVPVYFIPQKDKVQTEHGKHNGLHTFHYIPSTHHTTPHLISMMDTIHHTDNKKKTRKVVVVGGVISFLVWWLILTLTMN